MKIFIKQLEKVVLSLLITLLVVTNLPVITRAEDGGNEVTKEETKEVVEETSQKEETQETFEVEEYQEDEKQEQVEEISEEVKETEVETVEEEIKDTEEQIDSQEEIENVVEDTNEEFNKPFENQLTANLTGWSISKNITISFDGNGATSGSTSSITLNSLVNDVAAKQLTENGFSKTGYSFNGWNKKKDGSGSAFDDKEWVYYPAFKADTTLYAQWKLRDYKVTYENVDGASFTTSNPTTYTINSGNFTLNNPTKTGYDFLGWTYGSVTTPTKTVSVTPGINNTHDDLTFKANWKAHKYTVVFNSNGADNGTMNNQSFDYGESKKLSSNQYVRYGYEFKGWDTNSAGTNAVYTNENKVSNLSSVDNDTVNLYAVWSENKYTVIFNGNGASNSMSNQVIDHDRSTKLNKNTLVRDGYVFDHWSTKQTGLLGTDYSDEEVVTNLKNSNGDSITLYAQWKEIHKVTFNLNGGTGNATTVAQDVINGKKATRPATDPTREGYDFIGWSYDFDIKIYTDLEVIALWKLSTYTVKFDAKGGTPTPDDQSVEAFSKATKPDVNPTKTGYTFDYWSLKATPGVKFDFDLPILANTTLEANYKANSYTVTLNANGGTGGSSSASVKYDSKIENINIPSKTGYKFTGYYLGADKYIDADGKGCKDYKIAEGKELTAGWEIINYNLTIDFAGGNSFTYSSTYTVNDEVDITQVPTHPSSNTFWGWTVEGSSNKFSSINFKNSTGDKKYTAHWNITITLDATTEATDKTAGETISFNSKEINAVSKYKLDDISSTYIPTYTGHVFDGYYDVSGNRYFDENGKAVKTCDFTKNTTLYAHYSNEKYLVNSYWNDTHLIFDRQVKYKEDSGYLTLAPCTGSIDDYYITDGSGTHVYKSSEFETVEVAGMNYFKYKCVKGNTSFYFHEYQKITINGVEYKDKVPYGHNIKIALDGEEGDYYLKNPLSTNCGVTFTTEGEQLYVKLTDVKTDVELSYLPVKVTLNVNDGITRVRYIEKDSSVTFITPTITNPDHMVIIDEDGNKIKDENVTIETGKVTVKVGTENKTVNIRTAKEVVIVENEKEPQNIHSYYGQELEITLKKDIKNYIITGILDADFKLKESSKDKYVYKITVYSDIAIKAKFDINVDKGKHYVVGEITSDKDKDILIGQHRWIYLEYPIEDYDITYTGRFYSDEYATVTYEKVDSQIAEYSGMHCYLISFIDANINFALKDRYKVYINDEQQKLIDTNNTNIYIDDIASGNNTSVEVEENDSIYNYIWKGDAEDFDFANDVKNATYPTIAGDVDVFALLGVEGDIYAYEKYNVTIINSYAEKDKKVIEYLKSDRNKDYINDDTKYAYFGSKYETVQPCTQTKAKVEVDMGGESFSNFTVTYLDSNNLETADEKNIVSVKVVINDIVTGKLEIRIDTKKQDPQIEQGDVKKYQTTEIKPSEELKNEIAALDDDVKEVVENVIENSVKNVEVEHVADALDDKFIVEEELITQEDLDDCISKSKNIKVVVDVNVEVTKIEHEKKEEEVKVNSIQLQLTPVATLYIDGDPEGSKEVDNKYLNLDKDEYIIVTIPTCGINPVLEIVHSTDSGKVIETFREGTIETGGFEFVNEEKTLIQVGIKHFSKISISNYIRSKPKVNNTVSDVEYEAVYSWTKDYSACTAKYYIKDTDTVVIEETSPSYITVDNAKGYITYTANFDEEVFETQYVTIKIDGTNYPSLEFKQGQSEINGEVELREGGIYSYIKLVVNDINLSVDKEKVDTLVKDVKDIYPFELHLEDGKGNKVESKEGNKYGIKLVIPSSISGADNYHLVKINDDNTITLVETTYDSKTNSISFVAEELGNYAIISSSVTEEVVAPIVQDNDNHNIIHIVGIVSLIALVILAVIVYIKKNKILNIITITLSLLVSVYLVVNARCTNCYILLAGSVAMAIFVIALNIKRK